jgi:hypothetical protein
VQALAVDPEKLPALQILHSGELTEEYFPTGQSQHMSGKSPTVDNEYKPAVQGVHGTDFDAPAVVTVPLGHAKQEDAPVAG